MISFPVLCGAVEAQLAFNPLNAACASTSGKGVPMRTHHETTIVASLATSRILGPDFAVETTEGRLAVARTTVEVDRAGRVFETTESGLFVARTEVVTDTCTGIDRTTLAFAEMRMHSRVALGTSEELPAAARLLVAPANALPCGFDPALLRG